MESKWSQFDNKPVAVQLKEQYCGVTQVNEIAVQRDESGNPTGVLSTNLMRGVASISSGEDGVLMSIRSLDPDPSLAAADRYITTTFNPDEMIHFISFGEEESRIVSG